MEIEYKNKKYEVIIEKKKIKNIYIKLKEDLKIYISCNKFTNKYTIEKLIKDNLSSIYKMIDKQENRQLKNNDFLYLGNKYDIVKLNTCKKVEMKDKIIFTKDDDMLDKWLKKQVKDILSERLFICINNFNEKLPTVILKIRKMKTRWGVCNRANNTVTLNFNLVKYEEEIIDYVIFHELCHFIHPNHSKDFWNLVNCYVIDYKKCRNILNN